MDSERAAPIGRPRGFDADEALDRAVRVFWAQGYEGASLDDLTGAMGITRMSMYRAFGNKEDLFRRVLQRYTEGPASFTGHRYWGDDTSGAQLLGEDLLVAQAERWAFEYYNADRLHGQLSATPLHSWAADANQLRRATPEQLMPAMLTANKVRTVNKNGIRFEGVDYVAAELNRLVRRKVTVRHLPNMELERLFIEVFDGDEWVCTAYPSHTLTPAQRVALLAERRRQYEQLQEAQKDGARRRRAIADVTRATDGAQTTYGQNAAELAVDELGADVDLFHDEEVPA